MAKKKANDDLMSRLLGHTVWCLESPPFDLRKTTLRQTVGRAWVTKDEEMGRTEPSRNGSFNPVITVGAEMEQRSRLFCLCQAIISLGKFRV